MSVGLRVISGYYTEVELRSCNGDLRAAKPEIFTTAFYKKFVDA